MNYQLAVPVVAVVLAFGGLVTFTDVNLESPTGQFYAGGEEGNISDWQAEPQRGDYVASVLPEDVEENVVNTIDTQSSQTVEVTRGKTITFENTGQKTVDVFFDRDILGLNQGEGTLDFVRLQPNTSQDMRIRGEVEYTTLSKENDIQLASGTVQTTVPVEYDFVEEGLVDYWGFEGQKPMMGVNGNILGGNDIARTEGLVGEKGVEFTGAYGGSIDSDYNTGMGDNANPFGGITLDGNETVNFMVKPHENVNRDQYDQRFEIGGTTVEDFTVNNNGDENFQVYWSGNSGNTYGNADLVEEGETSFISLQRYTEENLIGFSATLTAEDWTNGNNAEFNGDNITMADPNNQTVVWADYGNDNNSNRWNDEIYQSEIIVHVDMDSNDTVRLRNEWITKTLQDGENEIENENLFRPLNDPKIELNSNDGTPPVIEKIEVEQGTEKREVLEIYKGGEQVWNGSTIGEAMAQDGLRIGFKSATVDEISVYDRLLTEEEMKQNMNIGTNQPQPVFSFLFNIFG